ncbi:4Fe-4S dicluster domain-containing protein [uncultured Methanobacterium sp.]|uniref:4Fe-4S dicluster domain-containing protein n=1 Tax=uncultured Methanobacterium sp. TaxID=176306 RepID=UPI002AA7BC68|nr:4Fe-4S dicluster domain-containing protein [uncultured Methanobacterium sp.]
MQEIKHAKSSSNGSIKRIKMGKKLKFNNLLFRKCGYKKCIQCGRCTASCPSAHIYPGFNPRNFMRKFMLLDIDSDEFREIIWKCSQCYSCRARCPRNCKAGLGVLAIQSDSVKNMQAPPEILELQEQIKRNLYQKGESFLPETLGDDFLKGFGEQTHRNAQKNKFKRRKLGFETDDARIIPLPEDAMHQIRTIMESTGFKEKATSSRGNGKLKVKLMDLPEDQHE